MSSFEISGPKKLEGEIEVKGAKNMALKAIAASILSDEPMIISNIPRIEDVNRLIEIIEDLGAVATWETDSRLKIESQGISKPKLNEKLVPTLRSSIVLIGPLLARFNEVSLPHPGGCSIGKRPIDVFIDGLTSLGVKYYCKNDSYFFKKPGRLEGNRFRFPKPSVTGTETMMMAAVLAEGATALINCACEPEIPALAEYLNSQGAKIKGAGTHTITIEGVESISAGECKIIPDRIETGSFAIMGVATNSRIGITNCNPLQCELPLTMLKDMGADISWGKDWIEIRPVKKKLHAINISTKEYPGFPTDLQAPMTVLLSQAEGNSSVFETIFEDRFMYIDSIKKMGADITMENPQKITIKGAHELHGKEVESPDLRAGIAMVIAGLIAQGETRIGNIYQIDRGYENLQARLNQLNADIDRHE
ncbi:UDP-N-acetylglucosamine 1-carboxyvinyltransferase [Patescibacteria group bacterium]|nr:UDP-N-acetylglucosamine 1-carboxyvinyltransferase [Patescibacteria group bacterium]MBU1673219.1 UDP-N-acetylglucosamine 1-carboxyvinyltransferase [Patescibacteria group bacterium]MBU1964023.1 UDP-N-acetylglucosamine 1-carboxyvinyltransferase [Patescibacteria group bacterium]